MPVTVGKRISPHLFPGRLHASNKNAQHWGWHGLVAYGSHSYVVVIDPKSLRIIQTLDEHQGNVSCARWAPKQLEISSSDSKPSRIHPVKLLLATADTEGNILLWDVLTASVCRYITENNGAVQQMEWIDSHNLAVLFENGMLLLWDSIDNRIVWHKDFKNEEISSFQINPFDPEQAVLSSSLGWIYFTSGIQANSPPVVITKYRITPPSTNDIRSQASYTKALKQMVFSPSRRDIIYFVLHKEILIFDLVVNLAVGSINIDRGRSPFAQLQLRKDEPSLLFCLHENGGISAWKETTREFKYEINSMWELQRFTKQNKKTSVSIYAILDGTHAHPELMMFANDGTLWVWNYRQIKEKASFCISGLMETISSPISSLGVRSFRKGSDYITSTVTAIGTHSGTLQILNLKNNEIESEFSISSQPLRCVRWLNQHTVITFSTQDLEGDDSGCYRNFLFVVDIRNGKCTRIRDDKGIEVTFIRNIKVSFSRRYFVVLLRDRPFELWDAQNLSFMRTVKLPGDQQVSAFAWSPYIRQHSSNNASISERFVVSTGPGQFHHFSVQKAVVSSLFSHSEPEMSTVTAIAWKDNYVVSGDSNGNIAIWEYESRKTKFITTNSKRVRGIRFAPTKKHHHALIIFKKGDFCIWDVEQCARLSNSSYLRNRDIKAIEGGWIDESHPIIATSDGCLRVMDRTFATVNSAFDLSFQEKLGYLTNPLYTPYILPGKQQLLLRAVLQHGKFEALKNFPSNIPDIPTQELELPFKILSNLKKAADVPSRCLIVAEYFSDIEETEFWTLVRLAIARAHHKIDQDLNNTNSVLEYPNNQVTKENQNRSDLPGSDASSDLLVATEVMEDFEDTNTQNDVIETSVNSIEEEEEKEAPPSLPISTSLLQAKNFVEETLLPHYDLLRSRDEIQREETKKAITQRNNRPTLDHTKQNIDKFLRLDKGNEAVELLLETSPQDERYVNDALMACVIAAAESKEAFQSIVQTVASNFISQNQIREGIQLLLLIKNGLEACQHLQNLGRWDEAALLAKTHLTPVEMETVYVRWCNELVVKKQFSKAVLILLSLGMFYEVLLVLREWEQYHTCMMFYQALVEQNLWQDNWDSSRLRSLAHITPVLLKDSIYMDYGIYLLEISAKDSVHQEPLQDFALSIDLDGCLAHLLHLKQ